jgi:hypothetical protein
MGDGGEEGAVGDHEVIYAAAHLQFTQLQVCLHGRGWGSSVAVRTSFPATDQIRPGRQLLKQTLPFQGIPGELPPFRH